MKKSVLLTISATLLFVCCSSGNKKQSEAGEKSNSGDFSSADAFWPSDSIKVDEDEMRPWENIPDDVQSQCREVLACVGTRRYIEKETCLSTKCLTRSHLEYGIARQRQGHPPVPAVRHQLRGLCPSPL